jgi:Uma2 family endonuclease
VFFPGRPTLPRRGPVTIPPDIAVEVVSPSSADQRHDRITKLAEYAGFGVRFYWMLDPSARTFKGRARIRHAHVEASPHQVQ